MYLPGGEPMPGEEFSEGYSKEKKKKSSDFQSATKRLAITVFILFES